MFYITHVSLSRRPFDPRQRWNEPLRALAGGAEIFWRFDFKIRFQRNSKKGAARIFQDQRLAGPVLFREKFYRFSDYLFKSPQMLERLVISSISGILRFGRYPAYHGISEPHLALEK